MQPSTASTAQPPMPAPMPAPIFAPVLKPCTDWFDAEADVCVTAGEVGREADDANGVEFEGVRLEVEEELAAELLEVAEAEAVAVVGYGMVLGLLPLRNDKGPPIDGGRIMICSRF
jgi:hypothetical protein